MTTLLSGGLSGAGQADPLLGRQDPTHVSVPPYVATSGPEVIDLAELAGLRLLRWQQRVLCDGLGERSDGSWSAFEVAQIVSRQNGKGAVFEALELGGLFLLNDNLIIHTAHEFKTAQEAFRRVQSLITNSDYLRPKVKRIDQTRGEEGIELLTGQRLRFLARSKGSGRGFSADRVILDEAMFLTSEHMAALLPTLSADASFLKPSGSRKDPQLWYGASAGWQVSMHLARIWRRGRKAALSGVPDGSLAYFEWAAELCTAACPVDCREHDRPADPDVWAKTNPGLGTLISVEHVAREFAAMPIEFPRERLGVGEYPPDEEDNTWQVIAEVDWSDRLDPQSSMVDPVAFAADATPNQTYGSIAVAGRRADGLLHVEVVEHRPGTSWIPGRLLELREKWNPCAVVIDAKRQASAHIPELEAAGVEVVKPTAREMAQACGAFKISVTESKSLRHLGQPELNTALKQATKRDLEGAWAWDGRTGVDISPLVSVTLAAWGHATRAHLAKDSRSEPWLMWQ